MTVLDTGDRPASCVATDGTYGAFAASASPEVTVCSLRRPDAPLLVLECRAQSRPVTTMCMGPGHLGAWPLVSESMQHLPPCVGWLKFSSQFPCRSSPRPSHLVASWRARAHKYVMRVCGRRKQRPKAPARRRRWQCGADAAVLRVARRPRGLGD